MSEVRLTPAVLMRPQDAVPTIGAVHINRPSSTRFRVRVQETGRRRWRLLSGEHKKLAQAGARMGRFVADGPYKRGQVLLTADYYDPTVVLEMVRR